MEQDKFDEEMDGLDEEYLDEDSDDDWSGQTISQLLFLFLLYSLE